MEAKPHIPFPSNDVGNLPTAPSLAEKISHKEPPWENVHPNSQSPVMFRIERASGNIVSYRYCDLCETRLLSAGYLQLFVFAMEKTLITIEGRHLAELQNLMNEQRVKTLMELGHGTFIRPEDSPAIDKISIEELTGPAPY